MHAKCCRTQAGFDNRQKDSCNINVYDLKLIVNLNRNNSHYHVKKIVIFLLKMVL